MQYVAGEKEGVQEKTAYRGREAARGSDDGAAAATRIERDVCLNLEQGPKEGDLLPEDVGGCFAR